MAYEILLGSRPLLSRSGCIYCDKVKDAKGFDSSRPLLSRSGCICIVKIKKLRMESFSSPFIEERLYFRHLG